LPCVKILYTLIKTIRLRNGIFIAVVKSEKRTTNMKKLILISFIQFLILGQNAFSGETQFEVFSPESKDQELFSNAPMLGQIQPVNQINLMQSYHLLDADINYSQWIGVLPADPIYQLTSVENVKSQETTFNLRYAYGLFRYTYLGLNIGFLQRNEAEFNQSEGPLDPELFIGQHFPWENGNIRLSFDASPSLGKGTKLMSLSDEGQTYKGNALRGGFKVKPAAAVYSRLGSVIVGAEASYSYFENRIHETEDLTSISTHEIAGGNITSLKFNFEIPKWERLGAEWMYELIQPQSITTESQSSYLTPTTATIESYNQNKFKAYARFKISNQMSVIPEINWIQAPPDGVLLTTNNQDIWLLGLTYRSKFN
jgi:hypothetical protein